MDISGDLSEAIKKGVEDIEASFKGDIEKFQEVVSEALSDVLEDLDSGVPIKQVLEDMDTEATLMLSAALSSIGEKQSKMIRAAQNLAEVIATIIVKKIIVGI